MNFLINIINLFKVLKSNESGKTLAKTRFTGNRQFSPIFGNRICHLSSFRGSGIELPKNFCFTPSKNSPLFIEKGGKRVFFATLDTLKLIHVISHPDVLLLAYKLITYSPGKMIKKVSKENCDGISMNWVYKTCKKIKVGQYNFGLARRTTISKASKSDKDLLIIPSLREKIVQKAVALVLHEIFEPQFLDYSHGFRLSCGRHSALQMIDHTFRGGKWVIEADLTNCLDKISHKKLMSVLSLHIQCSKTLALVSSGMKTKYISLSTIVQDGGIGDPKEAILSPLLCNIYLHILDQFMHTLINKNSIGKTRRKNPEYRKLQYQMSKFQGNPKRQRLLCQKMWKIPIQDQMDPSFRRLAYVRYADDFVICIIGPRKLAVDILGQVEQFLNEHLDLELNREKTRITKFSDGIKFLGSVITNRTINEKPVKLTKADLAGEYLTRVCPRLSFHVPILQLFKRLVKRGYFKWSKQRALATSIGFLVNLDHSIILRSYNKVIRGLLDYYSFADNRKSMGSIIHGLKMSCAFTLALKYKLGSVTKIFKTFGPLLRCPKSGVHIYLPVTFARLEYKKKFRVRSPIKIPKEIFKLLTLII